MPGRFETFESSQHGSAELVTVRVREGVRAAAVRALADALDAVPWSRPSHAYGPENVVPSLLFAVSVGDDIARDAAWSELWGTVHHQGTVYSATEPAVAFIAAIARTSGHPDRIQALYYLREIAIGDGENAAAVRGAVRLHAEALVGQCPQEPELVQRAIAWLATAFPALADAHEPLVELVPEPLRGTWNEVLERVRRRGDVGAYDEEDDDAFDRQDELEKWATAGWA